MTGRWPRGDRTHPGRVRSFISSTAQLAERVEERPNTATCVPGHLLMLAVGGTERAWRESAHADVG